MRHTLLVLLVASLAIFPALTLATSTAQAGGVVGDCSEAALRTALQGGGPVTFACSGTITLAQTITISVDTSIDGSGQAVTLSGGNSVQVFIVNSGVSLSLNKLMIANGHVNGSGGGVFNDGTLTIINSTISSNYAHICGGAVYNGGTLIMTGSTFSGNSAENCGGGIRNDGALTVTNSTFSDNSAYNGGGIFNNVSVNVISSTFSGNRGTHGGGFDNYHGTTTLQNTIVANNPGGNCYSTIINGGGNLSYPDATCPGINEDPMLGLLRDNGGPTQTMALHPASPAIDAADNAICAAAPVNNLDQRGLPRSVDANGDGVATCDIGAYEFQFQPFAFARTAQAGTGDCSSWADACSLQTALAVTRGEIWVASGVYTSTKISVPGDSRTAAFELNHQVAVYGGFAGHETARDQRSWAANPTILSGDLNQDDVGWTNMDDNAYHVVICRGAVTEPVILDGFTITRGRAIMTQDPADGGGGILNQCSDLHLSNLRITWNRAFFGGGIANTSGGSPALLNLVIANNYARYRGGGIYSAAGSPTLTNLSLYDNEADKGYEGTYGGGILIAGGSPTLTNLSLYNNQANSGGGGIFIQGGSTALSNSILWGNQPAQIDGGAAVTYSDIQNGYSGAGNIQTDPLFTDAASGSLRLQPGSPAIDAGNNAAPGLVGITVDLDGMPRFVDRPGTTDIGNGVAPIVDMGAYEWHYTVFLPRVQR